ncbi:MAG: hypothetical protein P9M07_04510 [Candidatus Aceula meridiana]|nr:hypothetical protein [Candidatus Aceula meridiana]
MYMYKYIKTKRYHKLFSWFVMFAFLANMIMPSASFAQSLSFLPAPGAMITLTPSFSPVLLRGVRVDPKNPFKLDFIMDIGDTSLSDQEFKKESEKLIKYFLASITIPKQELWVNLSPYEEDRIVPDAFGQTEMGQDLLAQDYILKQITASLIYPEDELGKRFWDRIYKEAFEKYGTTQIPVNTFNKVWIVPQKAVVYENGPHAFVVSSYLKVMLEEDYLSLENNLDNQKIGAKLDKAKETKEVSNLSSKIVREIVLPQIEREVNNGKNFANLRQIYNSLILATWFKNTLKNSILNQKYSNKAKIAGVDGEDKEAGEKIYNQYLDAFKKGVCDFVKVEYDQYEQRNVPRKYFSGGFSLGETEDIIRPTGDIGEVTSACSPAKLRQVSSTLETKPLQKSQKYLLSRQREYTAFRGIKNYDWWLNQADLRFKKAQARDPLALFLKRFSSETHRIERGRPLRVLDAGCGAGMTLIEILEQYGNKSLDEYRQEISSRHEDIGSIRRVRSKKTFGPEAVEVFGADLNNINSQTMTLDGRARFLVMHPGKNVDDYLRPEKPFVFKKEDIKTVKFLDDKGNPIKMDLIMSMFVAQYDPDPIAIWLNLFNKNLALDGTFNFEMTFPNTDKGREVIKFYEKIFDEMRNLGVADIRIKPKNIEHDPEKGVEEIALFVSTVRKTNQEIKINAKPLTEIPVKIILEDENRDYEYSLVPYAQTNKNLVRVSSPAIEGIEEKFSDKLNSYNLPQLRVPLKVPADIARKYKEDQISNYSGIKAIVDIKTGEVYFHKGIHHSDAVQKKFGKTTGDHHGYQLQVMKLEGQKDFFVVDIQANSQLMYKQNPTEEEVLKASQLLLDAIDLESEIKDPAEIKIHPTLAKRIKGGMKKLKTYDLNQVLYTEYMKDPDYQKELVEQLKTLDFNEQGRVAENNDRANAIGYRFLVQHIWEALEYDEEKVNLFLKVFKGEKDLEIDIESVNKILNYFKDLRKDINVIVSVETDIGKVLWKGGDPSVVSQIRHFLSGSTVVSFEQFLAFAKDDPGGLFPLFVEIASSKYGEFVSDKDGLIGHNRKKSGDKKIGTIKIRHLGENTIYFEFNDKDYLLTIEKRFGSMGANVMVTEVSQSGEKGEGMITRALWEEIAPLLKNVILAKNAKNIGLWSNIQSGEIPFGRYIPVSAQEYTDEVYGRISEQSQVFEISSGRNAPAIKTLVQSKDQGEKLKRLLENKNRYIIIEGKKDQPQGVFDFSETTLGEQGYTYTSTDLDIFNSNLQIDVVSDLIERAKNASEKKDIVYVDAGVLNPEALNEIARQIPSEITNIKLIGVGDIFDPNWVFADPRITFYFADFRQLFKLLEEDGLKVDVLAGHMGFRHVASAENLANYLIKFKEYLSDDAEIVFNYPIKMEQSGPKSSQFLQSEEMLNDFNIETVFLKLPAHTLGPVVPNDAYKLTPKKSSSNMGENYWTVEQFKQLADVTASRYPVLNDYDWNQCQRASDDIMRSYRENTELMTNHDFKKMDFYIPEDTQNIVEGMKTANHVVVVIDGWYIVDTQLRQFRKRSNLAQGDEFFEKFIYTWDEYFNNVPAFTSETVDFNSKIKTVSSTVTKEQVEKMNEFFKGVRPGHFRNAVVFYDSPADFAQALTESHPTLFGEQISIDLNDPYWSHNFDKEISERQKQVESNNQVFTPITVKGEIKDYKSLGDFLRSQVQANYAKIQFILVLDSKESFDTYKESLKYGYSGAPGTDQRKASQFIKELVGPNGFFDFSDDKELSSSPGGIDLGADTLDIDIQSEGHGFEFNLDATSSSNIEINGLYPVIISVTPVVNLPVFLGAVQEGDKNLQLSYAQ